jgi:hypothetical protein
MFLFFHLSGWSQSRHERDADRSWTEKRVKLKNWRRRCDRSYPSSISSLWLMRFNWTLFLFYFKHSSMWHDHFFFFSIPSDQWPEDYTKIILLLYYLIETNVQIFYIFTRKTLTLCWSANALIHPFIKQQTSLRNTWSNMTQINQQQISGHSCSGSKKKEYWGLNDKMNEWIKRGNKQWNN